VPFGDDAKHSVEDKLRVPTPEPEEMLDYEAYYPTLLPLRPPGSLPEPQDDPLAAALPTDLLSLEVIWLNDVKLIFG
jgi:hypothetical protein